MTLATLLGACKSSAPAEIRAAEGDPAVRLLFDRAEAGTPEQVSLYFTLMVDNPRSRPAGIRLKGWGLLVNGLEKSAGALLDLADTLPPVEAAGSAAFPLRLDLDMAGGPGGAEDYRAILSLDLAYAGEDGGPRSGEASAEAAFPRVREPVFTITGIAVSRAELINTRFRVDLRIDNPNSFPLDLSGLKYELYGAGRFWADGSAKEALHIPPRASAETRLSLVMNFINMRRDLLDQVLARRRIPYRFTGSADIGTGLEHLPRFSMAFDRSGFSEVTE
jgi:LEA14-like dessication related protein